MQNSLGRTLERLSVDHAYKVGGRSLIQDWLDSYWQQHFSDVSSTLQMDEKMHQFVQMLLLTGEQEMKGKVSDCHQ